METPKSGSISWKIGREDSQQVEERFKSEVKANQEDKGQTSLRCLSAI